MQKKLFIILFIGFILLLISIVTTNIYLLGLCEFIIITTSTILIIKNFKNNIKNF